MRKLYLALAFPFLERPTVALATINATRKRNGANKRGHDGRFVKPYRVK